MDPLIGDGHEFMRFSSCAVPHGYLLNYKRPTLVRQSAFRYSVSLHTSGDVADLATFVTL